ncbi:WRKY transcription factor 55-like protein [Carex littledalei]|uniref:WRKY transcription factor 55-like protein n=1 Tax=Carex littledalei TaxID=544730 RepID=A0A833R9F7_9POAL|nr:WRKY transcription factor 55-like protein [Carex littledalei]
MRKCPRKEEDEKTSKGEETISIQNDNRKRKKPISIESASDDESDFISEDDEDGDDQSAYKSDANYYGCEVKKQVQRLDEDPYTYEIVYCGQHSCLTSTTPLLISSLAPTNAVVTSAVAPIITTPTINSSNFTTNPHIESSMIGTTLVQMQPSTSIHLGNWLTRDLGEGRPVADMADVLFNSGSRNSSIDAIFSS